jgi:acyl-CoA hydrolase
MEAEVKVVAENPLTGEQVHTNNAYLVYVALDDQGRPTPIPPLRAETPQESARLEAARIRQQARLQQRKNK